MRVTTEQAAIYAKLRDNRIVRDLAADLLDERAAKVALWYCPDCAFGFDDVHADATGGYSCPLCAEAKLTKVVKAFQRWQRAHQLCVAEPSEARESACWDFEQAAWVALESLPARGEGEKGE